jgi:hypothetical protein
MEVSKKTEILARVFDMNSAAEKRMSQPVRREPQN